MLCAPAKPGSTDISASGTQVQLHPDLTAQAQGDPETEGNSVLDIFSYVQFQWGFELQN